MADRRTVLAVGLGLAVVLPGAAAAQASSQGRRLGSPEEFAARLSKIEEDLASADPNLRLATLAYVMENGSAAERTKALSLAVGSRDAALRDLGLRYGFRSISRLNVRATHDDRAVLSTLGKDRFYYDWGGALPVAISNYDVDQGTFTTQGLHGSTYGDLTRYQSLGHVMGNTVSMEVKFSFNAGPDTKASISLALTPAGYLSGTARIAGDFLSGGPIRVAAPFLTTPP